MDALLLDEISCLVSYLQQVLERLTWLISTWPKRHQLSFLQVCFPSITRCWRVGTDTTATTLVYLFWELSHRPEWQERIRAELNAIDPSSPESCPEWRTLANLEVLDAVVKEALRLHTAAPASLWRVVPKGGRFLDGYFVPENVCYLPANHLIH